MRDALVPTEAVCNTYIPAEWAKCLRRASEVAGQSEVAADSSASTVLTGWEASTDRDEMSGWMEEC